MQRSFSARKKSEAAFSLLLLFHIICSTRWLCLLTRKKKITRQQYVYTFSPATHVECSGTASDGPLACLSRSSGSLSIPATRTKAKGQNRPFSIWRLETASFIFCFLPRFQRSWLPALFYEMLPNERTKDFACTILSRLTIVSGTFVHGAGFND